MNPDGSIADNLTVGNQIVIFDSQTPYEGYTDMACVKSRVEESGQLRVKIELAELSDCSTPYSIQGTYLSDHDGVGNDPWDFSSGNSAGVCDLNAGFSKPTYPICLSPFPTALSRLRSQRTAAGWCPICRNHSLAWS